MKITLKPVSLLEIPSFSPKTSKITSRLTLFETIRQSKQQVCFGINQNKKSPFSIITVLGLFLFVCLSFRTVMASEPDRYEGVEGDDTSAQASIITVSQDGYYYEEAIQTHNFHDRGDEDWVAFHARAGEIYEITTKNPGSRCDPVISLYDTNGYTPIDERNDYRYGEDELLTFQCEREGIYFVQIKNYDSEDYGENTEYALTVYVPTASLAIGIVYGYIRDYCTNEPVGLAVVTNSCGSSTLSDNSGMYVLLSSAGECTIFVHKEGYRSDPKTLAVNKEKNPLDFDLKPIDNETCDRKCLLEELFGSSSPVIYLLKQYRDDVLGETPAGRKIIKFYYVLNRYLQLLYTTE